MSPKEPWQKSAAHTAQKQRRTDDGEDASVRVRRRGASTDVARSSAGEQHLPLGQLSKVALTCETVYSNVEGDWSEVGRKNVNIIVMGQINRIHRRRILVDILD